MLKNTLGLITSVFRSHSLTYDSREKQRYADFRFVALIYKRNYLILHRKYCDQFVHQGVITGRNIL